MLKKRDRIIASVRKWQTRYLKRSHKFGIELPKTVEEALTLDANDGNTLWADAISKEMENVRVAFEVLPDGKSVPIGAALNDLEVKSGDILNAYVQAPVTEEV